MERTFEECVRSFILKCSESEVAPQADNRSKWAPAGGKPEDLEALQGVFL